MNNVSAKFVVGVQNRGESAFTYSEYDNFPEAYEVFASALNQEDVRANMSLETVVGETKRLIGIYDIAKGEFNN